MISSAGCSEPGKVTSSVLVPPMGAAHSLFVAVEIHVFIRHRVINWFDMGNDVGAGEIGMDNLFQLVGQVVTFLHRPVSRHQEVHGDKAPGCGAAGAQGMEVHIRMLGLKLFHQPQHQSLDRKSTRLNSSHVRTSYAVFCLKKKKQQSAPLPLPSFHSLSGAVRPSPAAAFRSVPFLSGALLPRRGPIWLPRATVGPRSRSAL